MRAPAVLAAIALLAAGCGSSHTPASQAVPPAAVQPKGQTRPAPIAFGQPAYVLGDGGQRLRITPTGVLYSKGPYKHAPGTESQNGWFVAVALKVEAPDAPASLPAPISGGGLEWYGGQQELSEMSGNAANNPWTGRVVELGSTPVDPARPVTGIVTFDVPVRGGQLLYRDPVSKAVTSWTVPATDQGSGLDGVRKVLAGLS